MSREAGMMLFGLLTCFGFSQISVFNIGNRPYSMYYKSHALFERKGLVKLIYFKPKHFHRYSVWEIGFFFYSYIELITLGILFGVGFKFPAIHATGVFVSFGCCSLVLLAEIIRVTILEIQYRREDKYRAEPKPDLENFDLPNSEPKINNKIMKGLFIYSGTIRAKLDSLYNRKIEKAKGDIVKIDNIDKEFIQYYRDYKKIYIEKNKVLYKTDEKQRDS